MEYQEAIDFLFSRLPVFQNIGSKAFKPGLYNTLELCRLNGNPHQGFHSIHIGGTNGKGSTSHMLAAVLQQAGYKVGLYTSPHLKSFKERIKINGTEIEEDFIVNFISDNLSNIDNLSPSFFELTVCMAFSYFKEKQVDVAIIEVGMGGRLDSTNVISPILSLITNVSFDHVQFLGDTLSKIAFEKAGIIKGNVPVIIGEYEEESAAVFDQVANTQNTKCHYASESIQIDNYELKDGLLKVELIHQLYDNSYRRNLALDLTGSYQLKNVKSVILAVEILRGLGWDINEGNIEQALTNVGLLTGLKGRWQKLQSSPDVYCDTAHNFAGLEATTKQVLSLTAKKYRFVLGFVSDKDVKQLLRLFPNGSNAIYYFCQPSNMRAIEVTSLQELGNELGMQSHRFGNVNMAFQYALAESDPEDVLYIGGSTFVVADLNIL